MEIKIHRPRRLRNFLLAACGALILIIGVWMLIDYGRWRSIYQEMASAISKKSSINVTADQKLFSKEVELLRKQVMDLQSEVQIDQAEQEEIRQHISDLQKENFELREELGFYQNLMSEVSDGKGFKIKRLRVAQLNEKTAYGLIMVLTRIVKGGKVADGKLSITLSGELHGKHKDYDIKELLTETDSHLKFKIKHFKKISYKFLLPANFRPERVKVKVAFPGTKRKETQKSYRWNDIKT